MKEFEVVITETLRKSVKVMADSLDEAQQSVMKDYYTGEYILDANSFDSVNFETTELLPPKIKVVLLEPGKLAQVTEVSYKFEDMRKVVEGNIDIIPFDGDTVIVFNRDGKIDGLPLNRSLRNKEGRVTDIIAGKFFICKGDGDDLTSLSDVQIEKISERFKKPERFYKHGEEIKAVPYVPNKKDLER